MKRELNPIIFGRTPSPELGRSIEDFGAEESPVLSVPNEIRAELKSLRGDLLELEKETALEIGQSSKQFENFAVQLKTMLEDLSIRMDGLEASLQERDSEQNEQKQINLKIEELLARHNQIVRNFENKMTHLTRILSEQEIQILNSKSALEEAHRELARLRS